jgi:hypothetical protein
MPDSDIEIVQLAFWARVPALASAGPAHEKDLAVVPERADASHVRPTVRTRRRQERRLLLRFARLERLQRARPRDRIEAVEICEVCLVHVGAPPRYLPSSNQTTPPRERHRAR